MCNTVKPEDMHKILLDELEVNTERVQNLQNSLKELQENDPDPLDMAQKMEQRETVLSETNRLNARNIQIRKALNLIREGEYGYCQSCGDDMDPKRLKVDPASLECFECKTISEDKGRRLGQRA